MHIGKESNNLDEMEILEISADGYVSYGAEERQQLLTHKDLIMLVEPKDRRQLQPAQGAVAVLRLFRCQDD